MNLIEMSCLPLQMISYTMSTMSKMRSIMGLWDCRKHFKNYAPDCPKTRGYIVTIVENKAIDIYRAKQAHPMVPYSDETVGILVEYDGPNDLADCILKLPTRQRSIIVLKYHHGYELKEIAKMLSITYANALKIEHRAKKRLEALCKEAENALLKSMESKTYEPHQFSDRLEKKIEKLMCRAKHPIRYNVMRSTAAFLLLVVILFGMVFAISLEVRANVIN